MPLATLRQILDPAFRIAGINPSPGAGSSSDMYNEATGAVNRLVGSWNCSPLNIYTVTVANYPLSANTIQYTIGPGGDFDQPRPQKIRSITLVLGTDGNPANVRVVPPMTDLDDEGWANVALQKIPNTYPIAYYYDGADANGLASIYFWGQALVGKSVDIYYWEALKNNWIALSDEATMPDGYERAMVLGTALEIALLWPEQFNRSTQVWQRIKDEYNGALGIVQSLNNTPPTRMVSDAAGLKISPTSGSGLHFDWRTGFNR